MSCVVVTVPAPQAPKLDDVFAKLRDAKELHAMAVTETERAKAELARVQTRVDECLRAQETTAAELRAAKEHFDKVFGG